MTVSSSSVCSIEATLEELDLKRSRLQELARRHRLTHIALFRRPNVAWALGGIDTYVLLSTTRGALALVYDVADDAMLLVTTNNEVARLLDEELAGSAYAVLRRNIEAVPWYSVPLDVAVGRMVGSGRLGSDLPLDLEPDSRLHVELLKRQIQAAQAPLLEVEIRRARCLSQAVANAVEGTLREATPGNCEQEVAASIAGALLRAGVRPVVLLIGADERIWRYRHPLPTSKKVKHLLMAAVVGERWGLHACVTRMVCFGPPDTDVRRRFNGVRRVFATLCEATRPGVEYRVVLERAKEAYREVGFPDEWKHHHQGGPGGYYVPDFRATLDPDNRVCEGTIVCWNPTISGVKTEDTILVREKASELLSLTDGWPQSRECTASGTEWTLPELLVR
ncbi:MAG: M24 family metallopeptidase [Firmicutes bacterium]|nr:M24 family metallopeptidase [Bacillota bacterium]